MLVRGPPAQGLPSPGLLPRQEAITTPSAATGSKQRVQLPGSRTVRSKNNVPATKAPSLTKDRKQLQRKWFSKHAERIGLQKRENERLIQKLQGKINGATGGGMEEALQYQAGGSYSNGMSLLESPLGSSQSEGAAPMVVLERKLHAARKQQRELDAQDLTRIDVVVSKLMQLSAHLDADVTVVARIAAEEGSVLLQPPAEVQTRLRMLQQGLNINADQALDMATRTPELLTMRVSRLTQTLPDTAALCKSRGLPMQLIAGTRPDILLYSPETLMAKIDSLPSILEVSPRRARDLIVAWPALLRHSTQALKERYQTLVQLFRSLPKSFVAELLSTTPALLAYSPASLRAKFAALVSKYGAFEDDVVDMVLVDPSVLINAKPLRTPPLRTPLAPSRKSGTVSKAMPPIAASPPRDSPGRMSPGAVQPPRPIPPAAHQLSTAGALPSGTAAASAAGMQQQQQLLRQPPPQVFQPKMRLDVDLPNAPRQQQQQQDPTASSQQQQQQQLLQHPQSPDFLSPSAPQVGSALPHGNAQRQLDRLVGPVRPAMPASSEDGVQQRGSSPADAVGGAQGESAATPSPAPSPSTPPPAPAAGMASQRHSRVQLVKGKRGKVRVRRLPMKRGTRGKGRGSSSGNRRRGVRSGARSGGGKGKEGGAQQQQQGWQLPGRCKSVVDMLIKLAAVAQVPLYDVLRLCAMDPAMGAAGPKGLRKRLQSTQQVLGLDRSDTLALVGRLPGLLAIVPQTLAARASTLAQMLQGVLPQQQRTQAPQQQPVSQKQQQAMDPAAALRPAAADHGVSKGGTSSAAKAPSSAEAASPPAPLSPAAQALLLRHPELLLQDTRTIEDKLVGLQAVLGVPLQRLLVVLGSHPQLILGPTHRVVDQLQALADLLGGRPLALVAELAIREPRLLAQPVEALSQRFDAIAASFGSFRDDAADVVLADPSMLLPAEGGARAESSSSLGIQEGSSRGASLWAEGDASALEGGVRVGGKKRAGGASRGAREGRGAFGGSFGDRGEMGSGGVGAQGGGGRGSDDAQAIAAAALDEIIKAESQGANRTRRSRSRKQKEQQ